MADLKPQFFGVLSSEVSQVELQKKLINGSNGFPTNVKDQTNEYQSKPSASMGGTKVGSSGQSYLDDMEFTSSKMDGDHVALASCQSVNSHFSLIEDDVSRLIDEEIYKSETDIDFSSAEVTLANEPPLIEAENSEVLLDVQGNNFTNQQQEDRTNLNSSNKDLLRSGVQCSTSSSSVLTPIVSTSYIKHGSSSCTSLGNDTVTQIVLNKSSGNQLFQIRTADLVAASSKPKVSKAGVSREKNSVSTLSSSSKKVGHNASINSNINNKINSLHETKDGYFVIPVKDISSRSHITNNTNLGAAKPGSTGKWVEVIENRSKKFICMWQGCNQCFTTVTDVKTHYDLHTGEKKFKCKFMDCDWSFINKAKLDRHQLTHTEGKKYKCQMFDCGKSFSTVYNLKSHEKLHRREGTLKCWLSSCGASFVTLRSLDKHVNENHPELPPKYMCEFDGCKKMFYSDKARGRHRSVHTASEELVCDFEGCGKVFSVPCRLKEHMAKHTGVKPFVCTFTGCKWSFATSSKLKRHCRSHLGIRQFECSFCHKAFVRPEHLKAHSYLHTDTKPFMCNVGGCKASFSSKTACFFHQRKHGQVKVSKQFVCPVENCGSRFKTKAFLKAHTSKHDKEKQCLQEYIGMVNDILNLAQPTRIDQAADVFHGVTYPTTVSADLHQGVPSTTLTASVPHLSPYTTASSELQPFVTYSAPTESVTVVTATTSYSKVSAAPLISSGPLFQGQATIIQIPNSRSTRSNLSLSLPAHSILIDSPITTVTNPTEKTVQIQQNISFEDLNKLLQKHPPAVTKVTKANNCQVESSQANGSVGVELQDIAPDPTLPRYVDVIGVKPLGGHTIATASAPNSMKKSIPGYYDSDGGMVVQLPQPVKTRPRLMRAPESTGSARTSYLSNQEYVDRANARRKNLSTRRTIEDNSTTEQEIPADSLATSTISSFNSPEIMTSRAITFRDPETGSIYVQTQLLQDDPPNPEIGLYNSEGEILEGLTEEQLSQFDYPDTPLGFLQDADECELINSTINLKDLES